MPVNTIMGLFAQSPIKPLQNHAICVNECCSHLISFFDACSKADWETAGEIRGRISHLEKEADALKREIRLKLPRGIFMPVDRSDLLDLLTQQDKLANIAKDIAGQVYGRKLTVPAPLNDNFISYIKRCLDAAAQSEKAIGEFDELIETGFKGREVIFVAKLINQLDDIEDDTDMMQVGLRQQLMTMEDQMNPIEVIFLYKIFEWLGDIADQAQRVGARLELMISRS